MDYFKNYNDRFGHQAGDECLRRVGTALAGAVRVGTDLACRYGGEEFVIVLGDDPDDAPAVAERVRAGIQALRIPHPDGPAGVVTVCVGVAVASAADAESVDQLLRRADAALYTAKAGGRNTVRAAEPLVPAG